MKRALLVALAACQSAPAPRPLADDAPKETLLIVRPETAEQPLRAALEQALPSFASCARLSIGGGAPLADDEAYDDEVTIEAVRHSNAGAPWPTIIDTIEVRSGLADKNCVALMVRAHAGAALTACAPGSRFKLVYRFRASKAQRDRLIDEATKLLPEFCQGLGTGETVAAAPETAWLAALDALKERHPNANERLLLELEASAGGLINVDAPGARQLLGAALAEVYDQFAVPRWCPVLPAPVVNPRD